MKRLSPNKKVLRWIIVIVILPAFGYLLGQLVPTQLLRPVIVSHEMNLNDYYARVISIAGTLSTLLAVCVALFKEDIRRMWEFASLSISFKDDSKLIEVLEEESNESNDEGSTPIKAKKYEVVLQITNTGKLAAKNCEIHLEKLYFTNQNFRNKQDIDHSTYSLEWKNKEDRAIIIPSTGKAYVTVAEFISQENLPVSTAATDNANKTGPRILVANVPSPQVYKNGKWGAIFVVYSENARPIEITLSIDWNGRWENRLSEMQSKCVTISEEKRHR